MNMNEERTAVREELSTTKTSLSSILKTSLDIQNKCSDYVVSQVNDSNFRYCPNTLNFLYKPDSDELRKVGASRHALSQLCGKLGVPVRYLEKCIDSGRTDLATDNVNSWLEDYNKNLLIREYDGNMRGVLSDKYSIMDSPDIIDALLNIIGDDYSVKGSLISPERLHLRLMQPEMLDIDGEDLFAGIQVDSSDVGRSVLTVKFLLYKQVCTNGLVLPKCGGTLFEQKHIGINKDDFHKGLLASMNTIPSLIELVTDRVTSNRLTDIELKRVITDEEAKEKYLKTLQAQTQLSIEGANKVIDLMSSEYSPSRWGLVNALTHVAQDYTLDRRLELETYAGGLLLAV